ncbi:TIGR04149 family rSAM-modified RiPP [Algoriphagus aestuarii]|nr:TIGR04149 family rSAM-modified RiPP [Algoriphagus aestuarii]
MKKLNLELLKLTSEEILDRSQMKSIVGGGRFYCNCVDSVGSWSGTYSDHANAVAAGTLHCSSGVAECYSIPQP